jgi:hypothetical protein
MNAHATRKPVISVIVPCRGQLGQLRVSAPPLLADESVEYILVDHQWPHACGNFARAYWPIAKVVDVDGTEQGNWGHACNAGVRAATGQWLAFLDPAVVVREQFAASVRGLLREHVLLESAPPNRSASLSDEDAPDPVLCSAAAFARAGGYDPQLSSGRLQARDLQRRLLAQGLLGACLPHDFVRVVKPPEAGEAEVWSLQKEFWAGAVYPSWVRWPNPITVGIVGSAFGDVFRGVQYAYYLRQQHRLEVSLYPLFHGYRSIDFRETPHPSREGLVREILEVLDVPESLPLDVSKPIDRVYVPECWPWHFHPQVHTKLRWQGWRQGRARRIAYQFDATSDADNKNPTPAELESLLRFAPGYEMVRLGKHLSVRQCVEIAAASDLFVGVDSGMMHLCYAVGVPVFLICNQMAPWVLFKWHGCNHAIHCLDTHDFIFKARQFLGLAPG